MERGFWRGRRVFLTGHSGFKGGWLALWLADMGAEVHGYALAPPTEPAFHDACRVDSALAGRSRADLGDGAALAAAMRQARPEIVFHLAAQALVRRSYAEPAATYAANVIGTLNLLEAVRATPGVRAAVVVTSDKCYENREWPWAYRENETLGGHDPYSSSKACAELLTAAWRRSFLRAAGVAVATARAGNVIGGGDWAVDRLLPDFLRAADAGETLVVRSPAAVRPWQHVLEPLAGYLALAERLCRDGEAFAGAWNFGPGEDDARPVRWIIERLLALRPEARWRHGEGGQPHEAGCLRLDSARARQRLGWRPRWTLEAALARTLEWHAAWRRGEDMRAFSLAQIADYEMESGNDVRD